MKKIILLVMVTNFLISCEERETAPTISQELLGTWLVVEEVRNSDHWVQKNNNGVITDWQITNPFSGGFGVTSIQFRKDQMFYWNVDQVNDWDHFIKIQNSTPEELWTKYMLDDNLNEITLYTPFEYVGIIRADTAKFRISHIDANNLILENAEVQLKFIKTDP